MIALDVGGQGGHQPYVNICGKVPGYRLGWGGREGGKVGASPCHPAKALLKDPG